VKQDEAGPCPNTFCPPFEGDIKDDDDKSPDELKDFFSRRDFLSFERA